MARRAWSTYRRLMGNLIPAILAAPFLAVGLITFRADRPLEPAPLLWLISFPLAGWIGLACFGLFGNAAMRAQIAKQVDRARGPRAEKRIFVGYARPEFRSLLDAHEDVGFLIFESDSLSYIGDALDWQVDRSAVVSVMLKMNIHSWVGLGGWIAISTSSRTYLIEPRERPNLLENRLLRKQTFVSIKEWHDEKPQD